MDNLKKLFRFSAPKGIGISISKDYYLSVLSSKPVLPAPDEVLIPKPTSGQIPGFLAPVIGSKDKSVLAQPMVRGQYVAASLDQKTVLKLMVMQRDEAGFDPEPFLRSKVAESFSEEVRLRVAATWGMVQITFEAFDPAVHPALDFLLLVARRIAERTEGVIADPICQRYLLPEQLIQRPRWTPAYDSREHIAIKIEPDGGYVYTLGLLKFHHPELEISGVSNPASAEQALQSVCQQILAGNPIVAGDRVKVGDHMLSAGHTSRPSKWDGLPVLELLPPPGQNMGSLFP